MLQRLEIENYGLIARAGVEFARGATIFTGETGSGKTMLLGAIDFVLGARAGADVVRRGASKATVTLIFYPDETLRARLAADGFELDAGECASLSREIAQTGRSNIRVNGRPSTAAYVREIAASIAELVGQHEAQRLLSPAYHLELLDRLAGEKAGTLRETVGAAHTRLDALRRRQDELTSEDRRARERYDDACAAAREIAQARLDPNVDEEAHLNERRRYLDNVERISTALREAYDALAREERGATELLGHAAASLANVSELTGELRAMAAQASALQSEANDVAAQIARAFEATEYDPAELERVNARLALIERLKRKYGGSIESAIDCGSQAQQLIDAYENRDRTAVEIAEQVVAIDAELAEGARKLSALRRKTADALGRRTAGEFAEIALGSGRFEVAFEPLERIGPKGAERVEFLFAAHAGEPARPLDRVASGGELSRVLLALVVVLAEAREKRGALVFDEIDAGIGGATATAVGMRIGALARREQIVCVTHLAQLATWADRHYVLEKSESRAGTTISAREIERSNERETEIARMLSGEQHDVALRHARTLLANAKKT